MADSPSFALQQKIRWKAQFSLSAALMYGFANLMPHTFFDIIAVSILFLGCKHYWFHLLTAHTRAHTLASKQGSHTHALSCVASSSCFSWILRLYHWFIFDFCKTAFRGTFDRYIYFLYNPRIATFHCLFALLFAIYERLIRFFFSTFAWTHVPLSSLALSTHRSLSLTALSI